MELRYYQSEALTTTWKHIQERQDNPCIVLPTGAGKGVVLGQMALDVVGWNGRIVILAHVKELLEQTAGNIIKMAPGVTVGIYSAGLKARDLGYSVTVAGIQSIYDKADALGPVNVIAIDEAHRIPPDGEGMYRTFLEDAKKLNPDVRLIGLTATPYRTSSGDICGPDNLLNKVCYEIGVRELITKGFLSPLKSKATIERTDVSNVSIRGGEYAQGELQAAMMNDQDKVCAACLEISRKAEDRKSVIVFCTGIDHAKMVAQFLRDINGDDSVRTVFGDTSPEERARTIRDFKDQKVKFLVNVDVLTTGFDAPGVDCVAILRPTMSPGLFYQMCGRGFRLAPGKVDCLILDFGGNLFMHGPVDRLVIGKQGGGGGSAGEVSKWKECPSCQEIAERTCDICLACGEKFPKRQAKENDHQAADQEPLSGPEDVMEIIYRKHEKANNPEKKPPTLRVEYYCGLMYTPTEYVCIEHGGFARTKAADWWRARMSEPLPKTIDEALEIIRTKGISEPRKVVLKSERGYLKPEKLIDMKLNANPSVMNGVERDTADAIGKDLV